MFDNTANKITGNIYQRYDNIDYYFHLKKTNDSLAKANERLYNMLKQNYLIADSLEVKNVIDSVREDSTMKERRFTYRLAKVVANSVSAQNNYLVLYGDQVSSMRKDMGVVDANNAVVGVITEVSGKYAVVMSVLHKDDFKTSGKLFKTGETGTITWDGESPDRITFSGISKGVKIKTGDSVITSGMSAYYPKGLLIGRVQDIFENKSSSTYRLSLKPAANFHNIEFAYTIDNAQQQEIKKLLEKTKQKTN
jgi:rod shape-determining protein MreC